MRQISGIFLLILGDSISSQGFCSIWFSNTENLKNDFDSSMKKYLKDYYNNKNDNIFYRYLSKFYSIYQCKFSS